MRPFQIAISINGTREATTTASRDICSPHNRRCYTKHSTPHLQFNRHVSIVSMLLPHVPVSSSAPMDACRRRPKAMPRQRLRPPALRDGLWIWRSVMIAASGSRALPLAWLSARLRCGHQFRTSTISPRSPPGFASSRTSQNAFRTTIVPRPLPSRFPVVRHSHRRCLDGLHHRRVPTWSSSQACSPPCVWLRSEPRSDHVISDVGKRNPHFILCTRGA